MAADNNLDPFAVKDILAMETVGSDSDIDIIVYLDRVIGSKPEYPVVLWITNDTSDNIISPVIREYKEQNSCAPDVLREFLLWSCKEFPSKRFGLILWSHGTGWLPAGFEITPLSFGYDVSDGKNEMEIPDLASALKDMYFDFIAFDACSMADIEVAFKLRNKTDWLVASQTEILSGGYPYHDILNTLKQNLSEKTDKILSRIALDFFNYYNSKPYNYQRSASVAVINMKETDNLAKSVSNFISDTLSKTDSSNLINIASNVQRVSLNPDFMDIQFDLLDWINIIEQTYGVIDSYSNVLKSFRNTVIWQTNTEKFLDSLSLSNLKGLNVWIPVYTNTALREHYAQYQWSIVSGMELLFD
jgi:hypothetical protein